VSNVNRNPAGILELLNLNLQGEYPRALSSVVTSVVETTQFYLAGVGYTLASATGSFLAVNDSIFVEVPQGEIWAIRSVGLRCQNQDVNAQFSASIRMVDPAQQAAPIAPGLIQTVLQGQFYELGLFLQTPLILTHDWNIQGICNVIGGVPVGGFTSVLNVFYHRLTLV